MPLDPVRLGTGEGGLRIVFHLGNNVRCLESETKLRVVVHFSMCFFDVEIKQKCIGCVLLLLGHRNKILSSN